MSEIQDTCDSKELLSSEEESERSGRHSSIRISRAGASNSFTAVVFYFLSTFSRISVNRRRIHGLFSWQMYS
jgi:hypothetical protein